MDLNLDTLKRAIAEQLDRSEFAVFRHYLGSLDPEKVVSWDVHEYPDFAMFLDTARKLEVKMILFAGDAFTEEELRDVQEELEQSDMPRDDQRDYEKTLRAFGKNVGTTCSIELGFHYQSFFYLYEARADWYDEFLGIQDEIDLFGSDDDEVDSDGSMGGFFSNN